jgi:hypothetical protein
MSTSKARCFFTRCCLYVTSKMFFSTVLTLLAFSLFSSFGSSLITRTELQKTRIESKENSIFPSSNTPQCSPVMPAIRRISVIGERHSGTNFMRRFLSLNLVYAAYNFSNHFCEHKGQKPNITTNPKHCYMRPVEGNDTAEHLVSSFQNKAGHPYADALAIVMIRNPYDWAFSMHRNCWCSRTDAQAPAPFEDFMNMEWEDNCPKPWLGEETLGTCSNIMECRTLKLINYFNISKWAPNVEIVRHEDVISQEDSLAWLSRMAEKYNLRMSASYIQPVRHYKNWITKLFDRDHTIASSPWFNSSIIVSNLTMKEYVMLINAKMNQAVESFAGYSALVVNSHGLYMPVQQ